MKTNLTMAIVLFAAALGCQKNQQSASSHAADAETPARATVALAAGHQSAPHDSETLTGTVLETMDSGGYTYLRLKTVDGEEWAAVRETKVKKGETVVIVEAMTMKSFESKTLKRTFDHIVFGALGGAESAPAAKAVEGAATEAVAAQHAAAAGGPKEDVGDVKVPKATGADAKTVAEVFAARAALKDQTVAVRGKVVKASSGIMGRNWLHLRDGSGSPEKKDNDLTITSVQSAAVGDVVIVKGTVHVDRDFGAGYTYAVIVEDASVSK